MIPVSTATLVTRPAIRPKLDKGASAEVVAMATIGAADSLRSAGIDDRAVLGCRRHHAANGSGLQWGTVRNLLLAWVLTLPAAIVLSGFLYVLLRQVF